MNRTAFLEMLGSAPLMAALAPTPAAAAAAADVTIAIAPVSVEIAPGRVVHTIGYNGTVPGPVLRMGEGSRITVDVLNATRTDEFVHWHGFEVSPAVDGVAEFGTPPVPAGRRHRYSFVAGPAGTRWYHTHVMGGSHADHGLFTGQFGFAIVVPKSDPARYDREVLLALHEWGPTLAVGSHEQGAGAPRLTLPVSSASAMNSMNAQGPFATMPDMGSMLEARYSAFTINGVMLGADKPIRVRYGDRVLFRILNASATLTHRLALPQHQFIVVALDGNKVPTPFSVDSLEIGPGERVDAVVAMESPGVWVLGSTQDAYRLHGLGSVVEYAGHRGKPRWIKPADALWDYTAFGDQAIVPLPKTRFTLRIDQVSGSANRWTINGSSYPAGRAIRVVQGGRYRVTFINQSMMEHPMHMHGHTFQLTAVDGKRTAGVYKDTVVVRPMGGTAEIDFTASNNGRFLLHCHNDLHMSGGLAAEMRFDPA